MPRLQNIGRAVESGADRFDRVGVEVVGNPRPDFSLGDVNGQVRNISEWDGKVVAINFWATWCPPCIKEIPELNELAENNADWMAVFAVNYDRIAMHPDNPRYEGEPILTVAAVDEEAAAAILEGLRTTPTIADIKPYLDAYARAAAESP